MSHNSPFTVAGMSSSVNSHHNHGPNLNAWGHPGASNALTTSLTDSLSQSRSHYQPGYMMSASQNNNVPQGSQRMDEAPVVQTKAKMNHVLSRGSASDFGMDSMFENSRQRQRQTVADEDAPPSSSVNDIPNEIYADSGSARFQPRNSLNDNSPLSRRHAPSAPQSPVYIIVFGYPADKYSATVEYFKSLGSATEPDQNLDIVNCFRIGYADPGDAMRAVRKNGEVLGGAWMVGAKWQDPAQAESLIGQPIARGGGLLQADPTSSSPPPSGAMSVDSPSPSPAFPSPRPNTSTPTVGTPIRLAPSASAFRKPGSGTKPPPSTPQAQPAGFPGGPAGFASGIQASPTKGVLGQVSDLIFGW